MSTGLRVVGPDLRAGRFVAERLPVPSEPEAAPLPARPEVGPYRRRPWVALLVAATLGLTSCRHTAPAPLVPADALVPSPRLIVGRITAIDAVQGLAFVEIATDAPPAALATGTELIARTLALQESGRLRASRFVRGRILGTSIVAGQPSAGDEVVWLAP